MPLLAIGGILSGMKGTFLLLIGVLLIGCGAYLYYHLGDVPSLLNTQSVKTSTAASSSHAEMANPASVNCEQAAGGTLKIVDTPNGQQGMCHLPNGTICEEWSLMRGECGAAHTLPHVLLPLYKGTTWGLVSSTTIEGISGIEATSSAGVDIDDIAHVTTPFTQYYHDKLLAAGWVEDIAHEAGGAGSTIDAYKKDTQYVFINFSTNFKGTKPDEPVSCPCDVTLQVFAGAGQ